MSSRRTERRITRRKLKSILVESRGARCERCHKLYDDFVFDFHHRNPEEKNFGLSVSSLTDNRWEDVLEEVKKCVMLCANCHREVHQEEANGNTDIRYRDRRSTAEPDQMSLFSNQGDDE